MDFAHPTLRRRITRILLIIPAFVIVSCAELGPPPGGPEDKRAPFILHSIPASGALDVTTGNTVTIYFSERIEKPEGKKSVFISPRPSQEPKLSWKSDRLVIKFADSFAIDQTYIISLSTDIVDMRRNRLDSATSIAFSTGSSLDSGSVSGTVYDENRASPGVLVALYDSVQFTEGDVIDSVYGEYLTQTTAGGVFAFDYLPSHYFYLLAFEDRNRDERFNPGRERFAVPDRPVNLGGQLPLDSLYLTLTSRDTAALKIASAAYSAEHIIRVRLSSEINIEALVDMPSRVVLRPVAGDSSEIRGQALAWRERLYDSEFGVYAGILNEGVYVLELTYDEDAAPLQFDSLRVKIREDKTPPAVVFVPDFRPQFLEDLNMKASFSEPLDSAKLTDATFQLFDETGNKLPLSWSWSDPLHMTFTSDDIRSGGRYQLKMTEFEIADVAGNTLGDSLREYPVTTLDPDSTGTVSGVVNIRLPERQQSPVVLSFRKIADLQTFDLPVDGRSFKIELPAGRYLAGGFIDVDSNGVRDPGSAVPYLLSESVMAHPDTIAVRARFETAGIVFEFK